jgi:hypothetical protein
MVFTKSALQFLIASPMILCALIIVNAAVLPGTGPVDPPSIRSLIPHCVAWGRTNADHRWRKLAKMASRIVAWFFMRSGVVAPAGLCVDVLLPSDHDIRRNSAWVAWLHSLNHNVALTIIATNVHLVPDPVYAAVENAYNAGIALAATCFPEIARLALEPGQLSQRFRALECNIAADLPHAYVPVTASTTIGGAFFYTLAGTNLVGERMVCSDLSSCLCLVLCPKSSC